MGLDREEISRKAFFSGKKVIKWYEYKLDDLKAKKKDDYEAFDDDADEDNCSENGTMPDDPNLENEVNRIMNNFHNAHQDAVDDVFAKLAEEDLIAQICAPKQDNVDSFINEAEREGREDTDEND